MEDFTRDILEVTVDILHARGILDDDGATAFIVEVEKDVEATAMFDIFAEQARLAGFEVGYDEGYDDGVMESDDWEEGDEPVEE